MKNREECFVRKSARFRLTGGAGWHILRKINAVNGE